MPSGGQKDVRKETKERVKTNAKFNTDSEKRYTKDDKKQQQ